MFEVSCPYMDVFGNCSHKDNSVTNKFRKQKPDCPYKNKSNYKKCPLYKAWLKKTERFIK